MTPQANQPNLIYVFADQFRYQSCGYVVDEKAYTPNIDQLASPATQTIQPDDLH